MTLIEMMVVVTIIALFAALVLPKMMQQADRAQDHRGARPDQRLSRPRWGPTSSTPAYSPPPSKACRRCAQKPEGVENWQGPYLQKEIENDPWGHPYVYHFPGEHGDEPDIVSYGADGAPGGDGINADIVSWKN